jgi:DNA-binding transcriptional ArsR family regulator
MATIHVPDPLVAEIEAAVERERQKRLAQLEKEIAALERERAALLSPAPRSLGGAANSSAPGDGKPALGPAPSRRRLTDDDVLKAIRDGATNATQLAAALEVSIPTVRAKVKCLVEQGRVCSEGERRSRRLSLLPDG